MSNPTATRPGGGGDDETTALVGMREMHFALNPYTSARDWAQWLDDRADECATTHPNRSVSYQRCAAMIRRLDERALSLAQSLGIGDEYD